MNYQETLDYLFTKLPMYQRYGAIAYKKDIGNIIKAAKHLNNPHKKFKSIHIAGTNGKGSVAHMLASILQEAGYNTGLYTSPHLKDFRERIKINGQMITKRKVIDFVLENKPLFEKLEMSFFEMTVALAFDYFSKEKIDIAIIETGLGGRLDSTNIINPELSIITNIGLDHTNLLGNSVEKIAIEKAGIIKKETAIIIGKEQAETKSVFKKVSAKKNSPLYFADKISVLNTDLKGSYQGENICTTITAIKQLKNLGWNISDKNIKKGLGKVVKNTGILGRWQTLSKTPKIICDIGHNEDGIKEIVKQLNKLKYKKLHFVYGTVNDKNSDKILSLLPKDAKYYFCKPNIERGLNTDDLQRKAKKYQLLGNNFDSVSNAIYKAKENQKKEDILFIGGSTFVVAEAL